MALLGDGGVRDLPGGVEEYLALRRAALGAGSPCRAGVGDAAGSRATRRATPAAARKELARLERQLSRLAAQEEKLHARMAEQATDHAAVLALDAELRQLHDERARLEEEWLEAAETAG